ncbi:unnamed protein product [Symbiodinium sp. CCMP2592]|nr:unnamed protein product [Symbiodinium sp. CCMP2592]
MGRKWTAKEWEDYYSSGGPRSDPHHGAPNPKHRGKGKAKEGRQPKDTSAFPSFEQMPANSKTRPPAGGGQGKGVSASTAAATTDGSQPTGGLARHIQKAVNNLRRCETRLRKLETEVQDTDAKWAEWQTQMKKSFVTERSKYYETINRLKAETTEMQEAQEEAIESLQAAFSKTGDEAMDVEADDVPDDVQKVPSWAAPAKAPTPGGRPADAVTPPRKHKDQAPRTPPCPSRPAKTTDLAEPTEVDNWLEGAAKRDPYLQSPSTGSKEYTGMERTPSRPRPTEPRLPVKTRTKPQTELGSRPSLSDKLDQSRAKAMEDNTTVTVEDSEEDMVGALTGHNRLFRPVPEHDGPHWQPSGEKLPNPSGDFFGQFTSTSPAQQPWVPAHHTGPRALHHDSEQAVTAIVKVYDILDVEHIMLDALAGLFVEYALLLEPHCKCLFYSAGLFILMALTGVLLCQARWQRPFANRLPQQLIVPFRHRGKIGGAPATLNCGPAGFLADEHFIDERETFHISFWMCSPGIEPHSVDVSVHFPQTIESIVEIVLDSTDGLGHEWLSEAIPITPQLEEFYGSLFLVPSWIPHSNTTALVLDARDIDHGICPIYLSVPVTRFNVLGKLGLDQDTAFHVFVAGSARPLGPEDTVAPAQGSLIKVMRPDMQPEWVDELRDRLHDPLLWDPDIGHPDSAAGRYVELQTYNAVWHHRTGPTDRRPPLEVACEAFDLEQQHTWVRAPTERPRALYSDEKRIHSVVAVVDQRTTPRQTHGIIFLDLRPIGRWVQWTAVNGGLFRAAAYVAALQVDVVDNFTIVVKGGRTKGRHGVIEVEDGEVLEVVLVPTTSLTSSASPTSEANDDEDDSDDEHRGNDNMPSSSDLPSPDGPPQGSGPFGPPPPQPVNRPRSRSPRGRDRALSVHTVDTRTHHDSPTATDLASSEGPFTVRLAEHVEAPSFSLLSQTVTLPHDPTTGHKLTCPWPLDWLHFEVENFDFKEVTKEAISDLKNWKDILTGLGPHDLPSLHIYVDGSWDPNTGLGGFAIAIFIAHHDEWALFGLCGDRTHGHPTGSVWEVQGPPPLVNEQIAITTALLWLAQTWPYLDHRAVTIYFDCQAAGFAVQGSSNLTSGLMVAARGLHHFISAIFGKEPSYEHVHAHKGEAFNELVDVAAKTVARQGHGLTPPPADVCRLVQNSDLSWLAATVDPKLHRVLPVNTTSFTWTPPDDFGPSPLTPNELIPTRPGNVAELSEERTAAAKLLTLNSLGTKNKSRFFEDQLDHLEINIAFLQETKATEGVCQSSRFLRLSSASETHWGVAVWFSRTRGALSFGRSPWKIELTDIRTLVSTPRLLVLLISKDNYKLVVISGHCPHDTKYEEAVSFMDTLHTAVAPHRQAQLILAGFDLNGRPPTGALGVTGPLACGEPDRIGHLAVSTFESLGMWFPTTFPELHVGPSETWTHPQGTQHRIDFPTLGGTAQITDVITAVCTTFDSGCDREDHWPVFLDFSCALHRHRPRAALRRPKFDLAKLMTPEGRRTMEAEMNQFVHPDWSCHPDTHCQKVQDHLLGIMQRHFPLPENRPRASFITQDTWRLRDHKLNLKRRVRHRRQLWKDLLLRAFSQWRDDVDYMVAPLIARQGLLYHVAAAAISFATERIRQQICVSKNKFLAELAGDTSRPPGAILRQAKAAGAGGAKARPVSRPLPQLRFKDGTAVGSRAEQDALWAGHFGEQELGTRMRTEAFLLQTQCPPFQDVELNWNIADVPSLIEVEQAIRLIPCNKSPGLDNVRGEMLRAAPAATAKLLWPLFAKATAQICQPIQWRGGLLHEAYKRSGSSPDPQSFRSLFVSSTVGKCFHKMFRTRSQRDLEGAFHSFQLGARRHCPVTLPALYILGHARRGRTSKKSTAMLYLDTEAAYYRIIRQLAFGDITQDDSIIRVFQHFDLDPSDYHEMAQQIVSGGMAAETSLPATTRHNIKDFHNRAWFITAYADGSQVTQTAAGSRPGESWADIVFGWVYSRILAVVTEHATAESVLDQIACDPSAGPYAASGQGGEITVADATWADDSAWPLSDHDPEALLRKTVRLCTIVIQFCWQHGLRPNLKPGKSAIMLKLRGKGSHRVRTKYFPRQGQQLDLPDLGVTVPISNQYKHLGGVVDGEPKMTIEARRRTAIAGSAYDSGKKLFFANPRLELTTRIALFQATIDPVYFNLGLWTDDGPSWNILSNGYTRLLRRLLVRQWGGDAAFHIPLPAVHLATSTPPLEILLKRARLSLLCSMSKAAPLPLWAMLQDEQSWFQAVQQDLRWLVGESQEPGRWPRCDEAGWPEWVNIFRTATPWFKRQVKRRIKEGTRDYCAHHKLALTLWAIYRQTLASSKPAELSPDPWICRICVRGFKSRAGLGAHFFKAHQRVAGHRGLTDGTICPACGKDYHSENRLHVHLRDAPHCADMLRAAGHRAKSVRPGIGSRLWRKAAQEMDCLAVPCPKTMPMLDTTAEVQAPVVTKAHFDLSCALLCKDLPTDEGKVVDILEGILHSWPLYQDEISYIVHKVLGEIDEVIHELQEEYWSEGTYDVVTKALLRTLTPPTDLPPREETGEDRADHYATFADRLENFNWDEVIPNRAEHVTPDYPCFELSDAWEAEWSAHSSRIDASAVEARLWTFLPDILQATWLAAVQGRSPTLRAPDCFWRSPLSKPFRRYKALAATN